MGYREAVLFLSSDCQFKISSVDRCGRIMDKTQREGAPA